MMTEIGPAYLTDLTKIASNRSVLTKVAANNFNLCFSLKLNELKIYIISIYKRLHIIYHGIYIQL